MDRMLLGVVVVLGHPVILLSCLIGVVLFLSWIPASGLSNDQLRDGWDLAHEWNHDAPPAFPGASGWPLVDDRWPQSIEVWPNHIPSQPL